MAPLVPWGRCWSGWYGLASLIHVFSIPASVERALREQSHRRELLTWLRKAR
jgi:hypothetical protein